MLYKTFLKQLLKRIYEIIKSRQDCKKSDDNQPYIYKFARKWPWFRFNFFYKYVFVNITTVVSMFFKKDLFQFWLLCNICNGSVSKSRHVKAYSENIYIWHTFKQLKDNMLQAQLASVQIPSVRSNYFKLLIFGCSGEQDNMSTENVLNILLYNVKIMHNNIWCYLHSLFH